MHALPLGDCHFKSSLFVSFKFCWWFWSMWEFNVLKRLFLLGLNILKLVTSLQTLFFFIINNLRTVSEFYIILWRHFSLFANFTYVRVRSINLYHVFGQICPCNTTKYHFCSFQSPYFCNLIFIQTRCYKINPEQFCYWWLLLRNLKILIPK